MWVALGLTLLSGVGAGVALDRLVLIDVFGAGERSHDHEARRQRYLDKLDREIGLSPEQRAQVEQILELSHQKAHAIEDGKRAEYAKLRQQFRDEVGAILEPGQRGRFDQMLARDDRERRQRRQRR
jgi:hypothetical protein